MCVYAPTQYTLISSFFTPNCFAVHVEEQHYAPPVIPPAIPPPAAPRVDSARARAPLDTVEGVLSEQATKQRASLSGQPPQQNGSARETPKTKPPRPKPEVKYMLM